MTNSDGREHKHEHQHGSGHGRAHAARAAYVPGFSLLRLSALQRLGIVSIALALLWSGVYWALT
ncbi:hypothetical protein [Rhodoblastus sp.]|jgi:hypothetical protein|uniref:hypothetical protein n=1 Tax=Rhodoblastus sp. TaxID=1962975 RepID=UPI0026094FCE|nr:hypothetical protein [Rhodoblastus sp.]